MTIAHTIESYLVRHRMPYEIYTHPWTVTSRETARAAHVPPQRLAKGVLLEDDAGYLIAVLPASRHVSLRALRHQTGRQLRLAPETEVGAVFSDCEVGAIPALGPAYGLETILDDTLAEEPDIYFEGGDHQELIHVSNQGFRALMSPARCGRITAGRS